MVTAEVRGGGALLCFSTKLRLYVAFPASPLILALFFFGSFCLEPDYKNENMLRAPTSPLSFLLFFYIPITGLSSSVGVSLQLLVCSDAHCLIFDEVLFINQPPPFPPFAIWRSGKMSGKETALVFFCFFCFGFFQLMILTVSVRACKSVLLAITLV